MKLKYRILNQQPSNSILVRRESIPCLEDHWHYHEELELIYFIKSEGTRYIGNSINNFSGGEIYLIGSNLPHLFKNTTDCSKFKGPQLHLVDLIIVQFRKDFLGKDFLKIPEAKRLFQMLEGSEKGLMFNKLISNSMHKKFLNLVRTDGMNAIINLMSILTQLAEIEYPQMICSQNFMYSNKKNEKERMAKVISYLTENYEKKIELEKIAQIASMAPNAFCRFFKKKTQKSFSRYLTEVRIGQACRHLIEGKMQISEISYLSGFNSPSNFNRRFKEIMGLTPSEYSIRFINES